MLKFWLMRMREIKKNMLLHYSPYLFGKYALNNAKLKTSPKKRNSW